MFRRAEYTNTVKLKPQYSEPHYTESPTITNKFQSRFSPIITNPIKTKPQIQYNEQFADKAIQCFPQFTLYDTFPRRN